jgi:ketosteroid isomerase-like protein
VTLSASDVETLQAAYEAFARGDVEALVSMCDTDIEVHEEPELPDSRTWHGHEGARQYFAEGQARWSEFEAQPREFRVIGDATIVVLGVERGRGSLSGADVESGVRPCLPLPARPDRERSLLFRPDAGARRRGSALTPLR